MITLLSKQERDSRLKHAGFTLVDGGKNGFEVWDYMGKKCLPPKPYGNTGGYCSHALKIFMGRIAGKVTYQTKSCGNVHYKVTDQ